MMLSLDAVKDKREQDKPAGAVAELGATAPAASEEEQWRGRGEDDMVIGASRPVLSFIDKEDNTARECSPSCLISLSDHIIGLNINGRGQSIPCEGLNDIQDANCTPTQEYQAPIQSSCKSATQQSHTSIEEPGLVVVGTEPRLSRRIPIQGLNCNITFREGKNWEIVESLGEGAFGEVSLAKVKDPEVKRAINGCELLCVKKIQLSEEFTLEKAYREVEIMSYLKHNNIIWCLGAQFIHPNTFNIFLECLPGITMEQFMDRKCSEGKAIATTEVRGLIKQVMCGLQYLHSRGIAHRDLNNDNIMLVYKTARIYLIDFGNSTMRCEMCVTCNDHAALDLDLTCKECLGWHNGRIDDIRFVGYLTYRLLMVPERTEVIRCEGNEMVRQIRKKDLSLSTFVQRCIHLKPTAECTI